MIAHPVSAKCISVVHQFNQLPKAKQLDKQYGSVRVLNSTAVILHNPKPDAAAAVPEEFSDGANGPKNLMDWLSTYGLQ